MSKKKRYKRMILKVQRALVTNADCDQVMVYNEDRSLMDQFPMTQEVADIFPEDEYKIFVYGKYDKKTKMLTLNDPAPWQEW